MNKDQLEEFIIEVVEKIIDYKLDRFRKEIFAQMRLNNEDIHDLIVQNNSGGSNDKQLMVVKKEVHQEVSKIMTTQIVPAIKKIYDNVSYRLGPEDTEVTNFRYGVMGIKRDGKNQITQDGSNQVRMAFD